MPARPTHACPGCQRRQVPQHQLSCRPCWYRLPQELRNALNAAYHGGTREQHDEALRACLDWYESNPGAAA